MTIPFFVEDPITFKKVEVPLDIIQYCDSFTFDANREDLRYTDCVWMHLGYYGVPTHIMKEIRREWKPPVVPVFD